MLGKRGPDGRKLKREEDAERKRNVGAESEGVEVCGSSRRGNG